MSVEKVNLDKELYDEIVNWLTEYEKRPRVLTHDQMSSLHSLSTKMGRPSKPSGCGSCNMKALDNLRAYKHQYENPE
jgi:hypothetical protein